MKINHKRMKMTACFFSVILLFVMCDKQMDKNSANELTVLNGNEYVLTVDRIFVKMSDIQFPSNNLQESGYASITENIQYEVLFSEKGIV